MVASVFANSVSGSKCDSSAVVVASASTKSVSEFVVVSLFANSVSGSKRD